MEPSAREVKGNGPSLGAKLLGQRAAGILLHPTSLPGPGGVGDLGPWCMAFLDFLHEARASLWQVLPLGPTGLGGSPYQCTSSFAGNPLLVSVEWLHARGLVDGDTVRACDLGEKPRADFQAAHDAKAHALSQAFAHVPQHELWEGFGEFKASQAWWLEDYALYAALKEAHGGAPWYAWPQDLVRRHAPSLAEARARLCERVEYHAFVQYIWRLQWEEVRRHARRRGILIMGDIPIFPAHDSADVWAHQHLFKLDEHGLPTVVAGVPPDYFSATGQLWGNPLYRWDEAREECFAWWEARVRATLDLVDILRIDHFRGFMAAWEVPAGEETAVRGEWVPGPGQEFFAFLRDRLGSLPLVAEDLGVITPDVEACRLAFGLPGMKVLVFAFDSDASNPHLPHHHTRDAVVYTGTHDNDTAVGWYAAASPQTRAFLRDYVGHEPSLPWDLVRMAYASVAHTAVIPLQDVLGLGNEARMNLPGTSQGNWTWRLSPPMLEGAPAGLLADLARVYGRIPPGLPQEQGFPTASG